MNTVTIRITEDLANQLHTMKHRGESYADIISAAISKPDAAGYILSPELDAEVKAIAARYGMSPRALIIKWVSQMIEVEEPK